MPIETLVEKAKKLYINREGDALKEQIIRAKMELELIEINANKKFVTGDTVN